MATSYWGSASYYVAVLPLVLAVCGGVSAAQLGRAIVHTKERGSPRALFSFATSDDAQIARSSWLALADLTAMFVLISALALMFFDGGTWVSALFLAIAGVLQGGLALMAYLRSHDTIGSQRSDNNDQPGERHLLSRNSAGGSVVTPQPAEKKPMPRNLSLTRQERARFVQLGMKHYETLRPKIEQTHRGEYIAISVKTGRFTATGDDAKLKQFADSLGPDDFLWMTRVGSV